MLKIPLHTNTKTATHYRKMSLENTRFRTCAWPEWKVGKWKRRNEFKVQRFPSDRLSASFYWLLKGPLHFEHGWSEGQEVDSNSLFTDRKRIKPCCGCSNTCDVLLTAEESTTWTPVQDGNAPDRSVTQISSRFICFYEIIPVNISTYLQ